MSPDYNIGEAFCMKDLATLFVTLDAISQTPKHPNAPSSGYKEPSETSLILQEPNIHSQECDAMEFDSEPFVDTINQLEMQKADETAIETHSVADSNDMSEWNSRKKKKRRRKSKKKKSMLEDEIKSHSTADVNAIEEIVTDSTNVDGVAVEEVVEDLEIEHESEEEAYETAAQEEEGPETLNEEEQDEEQVEEQEQDEEQVEEQEQEEDEVEQNEIITHAVSESADATDNDEATVFDKTLEINAEDDKSKESSSDEDEEETKTASPIPVEPFPLNLDKKDGKASKSKKQQHDAFEIKIQHPICPYPSLTDYMDHLNKTGKLGVHGRNFAFSHAEEEEERLKNQRIEQKVEQKVEDKSEESSDTTDSDSGGVKKAKKRKKRLSAVQILAGKPSCVMYWFLFSLQLTHLC